MNTRTHELKTHIEPFNALLSGAKTCELRNFLDRSFAVGDRVLLREIRETDGESVYTGRTAYRVITHIQTGYGLPEHLCVLSYAQPQPSGKAGEFDEWASFDAWLKERPFMDFGGYAWEAWKARAALAKQAGER